MRFCEEQFGINRGIYNTIEEWLFQKGLIDITMRRSAIYDFLNQSIRKEDRRENGKVKIGHGNLSRKLNEYFGCVLTKKLNNHFESLVSIRIS